MYRLILTFAALCGLAGCATTNDSGVALHPKPDLSEVAPGTPIKRVAGLKTPVAKEPATAGYPQGAEIWFYEWDLPDDGVNNRMFTSVVVKDGAILEHKEETAEKWRQSADLHRMAKVDSALEDVASLNAMAGRYHRVASLRGNYQSAAYADTWQLLRERTRFIRRGSAAAVSETDPREVITADENPAVPVEVAAVPAAVPAAPVRRSLRELEAEELRIRGDGSLSRKERLRQLHEIWKLQREVTGEGAS
jgi:hypothetical protein